MYIFHNLNVFLFFILHFALLCWSVASVHLNSKKLDHICFIMVFICYILINVSRTGYGVDEPTYLETYKEYLSTGTLHFEYSFNFMYYLFSLLDISPDFFNKTYSTLFLILSVYVVGKFIDSPYKSLCLIFFLFFSTTLDFVFNAYRQGIAVLFILMSLFSFNKNNKTLGVILFAIGLGFHWSAVVVLLALLLRKLLSVNLAVKINVLLIGLTIVASFFPLHIIPSISTILQMTAGSSPYVSRAINYLNSSEASFYGLNFLGRLPLIITILTMTIMLYIYRRGINKYYYTFSILMLSYCLILLEMSYSFRNYYWILPMYPFLMVEIVRNAPTKIMRQNNLVVMVILHFLLACAGYYTSGIIPLIYE
ncbi:EpsG family protein [Enterobacter hormaechei]|uniref:EpsG family protein n=1 Tax=Enterobacter hormaechei TaxID=158836 RepID=UPI003906D4CD